MAKKLLGPWKVLYPVRFYSGGDTTSQAFGKHIQEIERIYGLLNALDAGKAGSADIADALQKHIDSPNPHPNWKPNLSFDDITGNIDAKRIYGDLVNAYIDVSHVKNLQSLIDGAIPPPAPDKGDGIIHHSLGSIGYIKFNNGFMLQWGGTTDITGHDESVHEYNFPVSFPTQCCQVVATLGVDRGDTGDFTGHIVGMSRTGFRVTRNSFPFRSYGTSRYHFMATGF